MKGELRFLLLQIRNDTDKMREHEVVCFARTLRCQPEQIRVFDLLSEVLELEHLVNTDMVLLGGSGDYSVVKKEADWLTKALESLRHLHASKMPTFASCWGFQAMARAMGGKVIHDSSIAEVGSRDLFLTEAGREDPVFGPLGDTFVGQMGHEDHVVELPPNATLLAVSERAKQAYRFDDAPIYCTQFHPELQAEDLLVRIEAYPRYVEMVTGKSLEQFAAGLVDDPTPEELLPRFVEQIFGQSVK